jgi:hypothetical protein
MSTKQKWQIAVIITAGAVATTLSVLYVARDTIAVRMDT